MVKYTLNNKIFWLLYLKKAVFNKFSCYKRNPCTVIVGPIEMSTSPTVIKDGRNRKSKFKNSQLKPPRLIVSLIKIRNCDS